MKYIIKNKIFSLGAASTVKDEAGNDLFFVKGTFFSFTRKKIIQDLQGKDLFIVRNKFLFFLLPKIFICTPDNQPIMMLKKRDAFSFRASFDLEPMNGYQGNFRIDGDFIARNYDIYESGQAVAHVRKNFNLIKDSFWLETERADLAPLLIAFVIGVDNFIDRLQSDNR